jgi:hypothetical protein
MNGQALNDHIKHVLIARLIHHAEGYLGTKEDNFSNRSVVIDKLNAFVRNPLGSSYCLAGLLKCLGQAADEMQLDFPELPMTGHCKKFWNECPAELKHQAPAAGDFAIWIFKGTILGHAGLVTAVLPGGRMETIEFNTREAQAVVREGDGVYRRNRSVAGSGAMPVLGYVRVADAARAALRGN